uniref:L-gulonate 3-dehydrogenase n=1 Tax=Suricata suricatta TaxID=37032 RepID=A0A673SU38_SURSU
MDAGHALPRAGIRRRARRPGAQSSPALRTCGVAPGPAGCRTMASPATGVVVIVGSGLIGRSWAMLFASGGFRVRLCDVEQQQVTDALENIRKEMAVLELRGSLRGRLSAKEQGSLLSGCVDVRGAVEGAVHIQVNPPYFVPLVELVPHPDTAPETVDRTHALMQKIGQSPVRVLKEIDGFALNRLQYAIISEAWRLVEGSCFQFHSPSGGHILILIPKHGREILRKVGQKKEGVVSPSDLDLIMSDGLGMRYAFIGPLETMHLNAEGMVSYCDRYGEGVKRVLKTFGPVPEFSGATVEKVNQAMCLKVPADPEHLAARRQWRDECLQRLAQLKRQMQPQ